MCSQHACEIRQLLDTTLQTVFRQIRDEYDQQCGCLLTKMECDIKQMQDILQNLNNQFNMSTFTISDEAMSNLLKQSQRIDVVMKNLEYDWQMIRQSGRYQSS
jgi:hypothetical protein